MIDPRLHHCVYTAGNLVCSLPGGTVNKIEVEVLEASSLRLPNSANCTDWVVIPVEERQNSRRAGLHAERKPIDPRLTPAIEQFRRGAFGVGLTRDLCPWRDPKTLPHHFQNCGKTISQKAGRTTPEKDCAREG